MPFVDSKHVEIAFAAGAPPSNGEAPQEFQMDLRGRFTGKWREGGQGWKEAREGQEG